MDSETARDDSWTLYLYEGTFDLSYSIESQIVERELRRWKSDTVTVRNGETYEGFVVEMDVSPRN